MFVKGTEITRRNVQVDVDPGDVLEQIRGNVYRSLSIPVDAYLNTEGHLVYDEEQGHGRDTQTLVTRTPSDTQVQTIRAFRHIYLMMIRD
jgi:hypothetical protein